MYQDKQMNQAFAQAFGYGGASLGAQYNGETPVRKPEVEAEMDRLADAVEVLAKTAESLCLRLEPIRRKTGAGAIGAAGSAPQPVQCALASMIRDRREAVERYSNQLQTTMSELEI